MQTPSFTSSSEPAVEHVRLSAVRNAHGSEGAHSRDIIALLLLIAVFFMALEVGSAHFFRRSSRIQRRIAEEYDSALSLRPTVNGKPSVLLVGNSLLLSGVDMQQLRQTTGDQIVVARYAIENTQALDWYFGLSTLFRRNLRPAYVVLVMSQSHIVADSLDGEYFAHFMMSPRDLWDVKRAAKLDNTTTANFLFANLSSWLGSRAEIRKWLLSTVIPDVGNLARFLQSGPGRTYTSVEVYSKALPQLKAFHDLGQANGVKILVLITATANADGVEAVERAGRETQIPVMYPLSGKGLPDTDYADNGFHLSPLGAQLFTSRFIPVLLREINGLDAVGEHPKVALNNQFKTANPK